MGKRAKKKGNFLTSAHQAMQRKGVVTTVYLVLRLLVILVMVAQFFNGNFENVFLCVLTLILLLLPTVLERRLQIDLPNTLEIIIMLFIFAAEILGEIQAYYTAFPYWDTMLHTLNGFLCAAIGFSLVDLCNRHERFSLSLSPVFMAIVAFCFSMTIGVLWEFFECAVDQFLLLDMQKDTVIHSISSVLLDPTGRQRPVAIHGITDLIVVANGEQISLGLGGYLDIGLLDTMNDLLVNFIGAAVFSFLGYFYVKNRGKGRFTRSFIPQVLSHHAHGEEAQDAAEAQSGGAEQDSSEPPAQEE
jgi:hypothetical protein